MTPTEIQAAAAKLLEEMADQLWILTRCLLRAASVMGAADPETSESSPEWKRKQAPPIPFFLGLGVDFHML